MNQSYKYGMNARYRKGARLEREIKQKLEGLGFEVVRAAGSHGVDLLVRREDSSLSIQVKARKKLALYNLFEGADVLVIKGNYKEALVVLPWSIFERLLRR